MYIYTYMYNIYVYVYIYIYTIGGLRRESQSGPVAGRATPSLRRDPGCRNLYHIVVYGARKRKLLQCSLFYNAQPRLLHSIGSALHNKPP